jgi:8-amino-7-oxononanoate synthase
MNDPLSWITGEANAWTNRGLSRRLVTRGPERPGRIVRDGRTLIDFGSNDYLGLAHDPRVRLAAERAIDVYGWGAGASALVSGWTEAHQELADALARFEQSEAVALFPTGFAANLGTVAALAGAGDAVYVDRLAHASLVDGARLSGARLRVFPHNDADRLASILARERVQHRRALIVTEGIFSMDGDLAPLADLVDVADRFEAMLLVDEAHATGVIGPDGRGAAAACGVADRVPIRVGTLSKALGSIGGFVAGSRPLIDWLINHARTMIYSTSLPAAAAAAAREALSIAVAEPQRSERLQLLTRSLRRSLVDLALPTIDGPSPIVPIVTGQTDLAVSCAEMLNSRGFFVPAIRPPTVPDGTARVRISITANHVEADVAELAAALGDFQPGAISGGDANARALP